MLDPHLGNVGHRCAIDIGLEIEVLGSMSFAVGNLAPFREFGLEVADFLRGFAEGVTSLDLRLRRLLVFAAGGGCEGDECQANGQGRGAAAESRHGVNPRWGRSHY